jgi:hypothetical protein
MTRLLVAPALCAALLPAQTSTVIPAANAAVEGNSLDPEPFGFNQITHLCYVDRSLLAAVPNGATLSQIAYRRDWGSTANVATMQRLARGLPAPAIWEIWMVNYTGPVLNPPNLLSPPNWTNVRTPILVNFPDLPRGAGPTAPFDLQFAFDVPLVYTGGSLGIRHRAYESNAATFAYYVDAEVSPVTAGSVQRISPSALGCPAGENRCEGYAPNPGGGDLEFYLYGGKPTTPAVAYLGASSTTWLGTPLPLSLGFFGLAACSVYTDLTVPLPTVTNVAGIGGVRVPVPAQAALAGATLYGQWLAQDDRVQPAVNLATSDGLAFTLGPTTGGYALPMSIVSAAQNLAVGRSGFVRLGEGPVFRLSW